MYDYIVSYKLGDMYHSYIETADNEASAILKVINRLPNGGKAILHEFKIEKYIEKWN